MLLVAVAICTSLGIFVQATFNSSNSSRISLQAQQYAEAEAALIRAIKYDELTAHERVPIDNSIYQKEIEISDETETADNIKQKTVSILVYRGNEETPRYTLKVPRLEVEASSGVPVGTIIAWASNNDPKDGIWLECNGQSCFKYPKLSAVLGSNKVPDYRGRFLEADENVGIIKEPGLPNIIGQHARVTWPSNGRFTTGAFYATTNGSSQAWVNGGESSLTLNFDASRCSVVYGRSDTVQPASVTVRYLIKAE